MDFNYSIWIKRINRNKALDYLHTQQISYKIDDNKIFRDTFEIRAHEKYSNILDNCAKRFG